MPEVDLNTVSGLIEAINNYGGLQSNLEIYDASSGNLYRVVAIYAATEVDNQEDVNTLCLDIERVK